MSNLIITIIAIALVAVAALAGMYYGGSAFQTGQVKSLAGTLISQGQQIASAWTVYVSQGGAQNFAPTGAEFYQLRGHNLVPNYLNSWPIVPRNVANPTSGTYIDDFDNWTACPHNLTTSCSAYSADPAVSLSNVIGFQLKPDDFGRDVCREFVRQIYGANAEATPRTPPGYNHVWPAGRYATCFFRDDNSNGIYDSGENAGTRIYWKVF